MTNCPDCGFAIADSSCEFCGWSKVNMMRIGYAYRVVRKKHSDEDAEASSRFEVLARALQITKSPRGDELSRIAQEAWEHRDFQP